ncbi:MAG: serine hydrolase [Deltaproteobacteria bacterium]|nr:serine hydrolase [Deltaproteobacteria bacterium]
MGLMIAATCGAYPLDGYAYTGIARVEAYRLAMEGKVRAPRQPPGALLSIDQVDIRLAAGFDFEIPPPDTEFAARVKNLLGDEADRYALAVLDLSNFEQPRYAEHRGTARANPGSVGKILIAQGLFQALADVYPDNIDARLDILRHTVITADEFIQSDHHVVPVWQPGAARVNYPKIQIGDQASLYTYLDWMLSASSNAAASMVLKHLMLLVHFGTAYPVSETEAQQFFKDASKKELAALLARALQDPVTRNGLDLEQLRQGSFFTRKGKQLVPGTTSYATPQELMRWLIKLEQGKLVDAFSSREIKRLLYMTQRRIRYASAPALADSAVYFKSGSLYKCKPEPNFKCKKYHGNVTNMLNSVAIIEAPADQRQLYYMVVVMSNVLRKNSAVVHQTLATRIHRMLEKYYKVGKFSSGSSPSGRQPRQGQQ